MSEGFFVAIEVVFGKDGILEKLEKPKDRGKLDSVQVEQSVRQQNGRLGEERIRHWRLYLTDLPFINSRDAPKTTLNETVAQCL